MIPETVGIDVNRSGLLLGVASVLAGTSVLMVVLGAAFNLIFAILAVPFAAAAYFLWMDATGRLDERFRRQWWATGRDRQQYRATRGTTTSQRGRPPRGETTSHSQAREILGVGPEADQAEIRAAYRERVKEVHPDADNGNEEAFKRVSTAYERLRE